MVTVNRPSLNCAARIARRLAPPVLACVLIFCGSGAQCSIAAQSAPHAPQQKASAHGARIHGVVTSGTLGLPGAYIVAISESSGRKFTAITDGAGAYSLQLPDDGSYVVRAVFRGLTSARQRITIEPGAPNAQPVNFSFDSSANGLSNLSSIWPSVILPPISISALSFQPAESVTGGNSGGSFPAFPGDPQFSGDSFSISGQPSIVNPYFLMADSMRNDFEDGHELQGPAMLPSAGPSAQTTPLPGGIGSAGGNAATPHGEIYWGGANSAFNAQPFNISGPAPHPGYNSNSFGATIGLEPFLPGLTKPSARDFVVISYAGLLSTTLSNQYGTVPTDLERAGNFSQLVDPADGLLIPIFPPRSNTPFPNNTINTPLDPAALALLYYLPEPNLNGAGGLNYHLLTTQGSHSQSVGMSLTHNLGEIASRTNTSTAPSQIINANFNFGSVSNDVTNIFPALDGKNRAQGYALSLGYTVVHGPWVASFSAVSSRNNARVTNPYTNGEDIASTLGLFADGPGTPINTNPFNYGLPNLVFNNFTNFSETQPNSQLTQVFGVSGNAVWTDSSHTVRFGGDLHRVDFNLIGSPNSTATYIFTGLYTQIENPPITPPVPKTGDSFADFLLGLPQNTSLESPNQKAYARQTNFDVFLRDDWRIARNFMLLLGLRYDYYPPFVEKYNRLSTLDYNSDFSDVAPVQPNQIGSVSGARYPRGLVNPDRNNFSPHLGFAWEITKSTVLRGGYGINYTAGQYGAFIQDLAYQPPYANVQVNANIPHDITVFTLQNGFGSMADDGNYSVNRNYRTPYVQNRYLSLQQTLPAGIFIDVAYVGAKGTALDVISAPGFINNQLPFASAFFDFEASAASSTYNALVVRAKKPLRRDLTVQVVYTYSHAIDDASSINAGVPVVIQNWQDLNAEESNSSFDIRHQAIGSFLYQLPFGLKKLYLNKDDWASRVFGNWSLMGSFIAATGMPLTPYISAAVSEVERGTHGSLRPNRVAGTSITSGGGSLKHWFNTAAFTTQFGANQEFGDASRYSIPGPGVDSVNLSLSKILELSGSRSMEFRVSATNAFNHVQFAGVNTQAGASAFGQVNAFQPMRQLGFLARFVF